MTRRRARQSAHNPKMSAWCEDTEKPLRLAADAAHPSISQEGISTTRPHRSQIR